MMTMLQNDLILRALRNEEVERPPVWMMRQAGRYLPEYMELRARYDFFTRVQTPELAAAITLQPIDIIGPDAAIIFSDILVVPQAMGVEVLMEEGRGPLLPHTMQTTADIDALITEGAHSHLQYVYDAIAVTTEQLQGRVPLIGFAGAPFTILCYMVEGKGSKTWEKAKHFCFGQPELAHKLLQKITDVTIAYLKEQVVAGAHLLQVFDSWSGCLSRQDFETFAQPYLLQIVAALQPHAPVIIFPKGSWYALPALAGSGAAALGIDWCTPPGVARSLTKGAITLQGNFDPAWLLLPPEKITAAVHQMIDAFGKDSYIANLGHGITPNVPVSHAKAFVDAVKNYKAPF